MSGRTKHRAPLLLSGRNAYRTPTDRIKRPREVPAYDLDLLEDLRQPTPTGNSLPVTHRCHSCGRCVSGERRFCGPCLADRL